LTQRRKRKRCHTRVSSDFLLMFKLPQRNLEIGKGIGAFLSAPSSYLLILAVAEGFMANFYQISVPR
jgi:hypothetical protein